MGKLGEEVLRRHWLQLGRCPVCMRAAFQAAVAAWLLSMSIFFLAGTPALLAPSVAAATALTGLWLAHTWVFSSHVVRATAVRGYDLPDASRRRFLLTFLRTLVFTATLTSLPGSLAAQGCNCYSDSNCQCPPDYPQCVFNPSTGEAICCGPGAVGCAGPSVTWCCPPGSNCYGTDSQCQG